MWLHLFAKSKMYMQTRLESLSTAHRMPQETDQILRTKNEINVCTKITIEIARDGPIPIFYDNVL